MQAVLGDGFFQDFAGTFALRDVVARQEDHPQRQVARCGRGEAHLRQVAGQQLVRDLGQHPGAVAALAVGGHRAAVRVVHQRGDSQPEDLVAAPPVLLRDEADAAGVVLVAVLIKRRLGREWCSRDCIEGRLVVIDRPVVFPWVRAVIGFLQK